MVRAFDVSPRVFPGVEAVALAGLDSIRDGSLPRHVAGSFARVVVGTVLALVPAIRLGLGFAWRGLIAAEMIATNIGLGYMLFLARDFYRTEVIVFGMIVIGVLWLLIDRLLLAPLERATIERWGMVRAP